ncbi:MAG: hypothetical protein QNI90_16820 [Dinoroseobacter sp.]|nr:hypothetical protein [Dinoroseobacter sp.]
MRIEFRIGDIDFYGVSFEQFDDFPAFSEKWAGSIVPGKALLTSWDHVSQQWSRRSGRKKLKIAPALQCFSIDTFGVRDQAAEAAKLGRILEGLGASLPQLKAAIEDTVPASSFTFDAADAVPEAARASDSWQVFGEARFYHFVLRFPVGRVNDWALLTVATDFVLSRRRIGKTVHVVGASIAPETTTLADRVLDMMSGSGRHGSSIRPH